MPITDDRTHAASDVPGDADLLCTVRRIFERCGIGSNERVAVAVSGGVDSMALLSLCRVLRDNGALASLCAIHINHGLRPAAETDADYRTVRDYCAMAGIALHYVALSPDEMRGGDDDDRAEGTEAAARRARLRHYAAMLRSNNMRYLCTAHHRDDNVETVLMRLLQGGGIGGLAAMPALRPMTTDGYRYHIVRPLLTVGKQALYRWARAAAIPYREDSSNSDTTILRNAVRDDIVPVIGRHFPAYRRALEQIIDQAAVWRQYIDDQHRIRLPWQYAGRQARIAAADFFAAHSALQFQSFYAVTDWAGRRATVAVSLCAAMSDRLSAHILRKQRERPRCTLLQ